jgi:hypothetical protein
MEGSLDHKGCNTSIHSVPEGKTGLYGLFSFIKMNALQCMFKYECPFVTAIR